FVWRACRCRLSQELPRNGRPWPIPRGCRGECHATSPSNALALVGRCRRAPGRRQRASLSEPPGAHHHRLRRRPRLRHCRASDRATAVGRFGQPFIVENRPGAGTNLATEAVVRASPDGHTLLLAGAVNAVNATLYEKLKFDFVKDIAPVAGIIRFPNLME